MFGPGGPSLLDLVLEGLSATDRGYDHLAPKFDATPFRTPDPLLDHVAGQLGPVSRVLDLGCGTGAVARRWAGLYDEAVGVDFSAGMLAEARRFEPPAGKTVRWIHADVLRWEPDAEFDLVTSFGAFGHFVPEDQPAFLRVVHRALRPGGRFVFVTGPRPSPLRPVFWAAHGFNLVMRIRNAIVPPPFVMYYLTFSLPEALERCRAAGLEPAVRPLGWQPRPDLVLVEAVRA
jgi:SAM-dependent methyltransferase